MKAFGGKPYPFTLALTKKVAAEPLKDRLASTTAAGMKKVFQALQFAGQRELRRRLRVQEGVQGADGFLGHREAGDQGPRLLCGARHPHHQGGHVASHSSRSGPAGAVAPHADILSPDPEMAEIALRNIKRRAKHKVTRPEIKLGDMVRIESRGSYRVNEIAWSEKVYRVASAERGDGGEVWLGGVAEKVVHRDLRKVPENSAPEPRGLEVQSRQRRPQRDSRLPPPLLMLSRLYSRQLRLPLTNELLSVGLGASRRHRPTERAM